MIYLVDLDKTKPYVDVNGNGWWFSYSEEEVLELYKELIGWVDGFFTIQEVFLEDGIVKAKVKVDSPSEELEGLYLSPSFTGVLSEGKEVIGVHSVRISRIPLCKEYVDGLTGFRPLRGAVCDQSKTNRTFS